MAEPEDLISDATASVEEHDANASHDAGAMPTPEEEAAAKKNVPADPKVKDAYKEQIERGAKVQGEGEIS
jgi:hypothetical protein